MPFVSVALPLPVRRQFDYLWPEGYAGPLGPGQRVRVPFGRQSHVGFCVGLPDAVDIDPARLKPVEDVVDPAPLVGPELLRLTRWMAEYYACSWGEALSAVLPAGVKRGAKRRRVSMARIGVPEGEVADRIAEVQEGRPEQARVLRLLAASPEAIPVADLARRAGTSTSPIQTLARRGLVTIEEVEVEDDPFAGLEARLDETEALTPDQTKALAAVHAAVLSGKYASILLWGVTGSGKTEVYIRAIAETLARGKQAIVLVPEIALTPQTVRRFRARFDRVAVLHSGLTETQRRAQWERIARREADVVIGPRSAVFAPVADLGLVVLDEEHEPSFKQNSTPRYHARDVAIMRAHHAGAVVVLGSATPSLETWANSMRGKYGLAILPRRVQRRPLPPVEVVDMAREAPVDKATPLLSHSLVMAMREALGKGEQVILFRNRRGHSTFVGCFRCHHVVRCPRCDVALTWHAIWRRAICHYCNHEVGLETFCPDCKTGRLSYLGAGTERVESVVEKLFPEARLARMDSDTMVTRGAYERVLGDFESRKIDVLVGTQMIGKGLDFPEVTVVGVLSADSVLHFPDFRSAERTFQLITQVAGRAGRGERPGRVVVQTLTPLHYAVQAAARHDFRAFVEKDLVHRKELGYPPFGRLARVVCHGPDEEAVHRAAERAAAALLQAAGGTSAQVLGPSPCPLPRLEDRFRWHVLVKAGGPSELARIVAALDLVKGASGKTQTTIDVDPLDMI